MPLRQLIRISLHSRKHWCVLCQEEKARQCCGTDPPGTLLLYTQWRSGTLLRSVLLRRRKVRAKSPSAQLPMAGRGAAATSSGKGRQELHTRAPWQGPSSRGPAGTEQGLGDNPAGTLPQPRRAAHATRSLSHVHAASPGRGGSGQQQQALRTAQAEAGPTPFVGTASTKVGQPGSKAHKAEPCAIAAC